MFISKKSIHFIDTSQTIHLENNSNNSSTNIVSFAQLLYCLNNAQSCAYINTSLNNHYLISLLEQVFLRTNFAKEFPHIHIDYYLNYKHSILTRGILSQAEFQNVKIDKLTDMLLFYKYNYIIFDNLTAKSEELSTLLNILSQDLVQSNIIIFGNLEVYTLISKYISKKYSLTLNSLKYENLDKLNFSICSHNEIITWIIIAFNFSYLKTKYSKRFFLFANQHQISKEISFILNLKKYLKPVTEFENWDVIHYQLDLHQTPLKDTSLENLISNQFISLLIQSYQLEGITNIINTSQESIDSIINRIIQLTKPKDAILITNSSKNDNKNLNLLTLKENDL